jgi:hypothetical protein
MGKNTFRLGWTRHVALRRRGIHREFWWESQKKRDHREDQEVRRWIILKWIFEMDKACSTEAKRNAYRILVGKPEEKRPSGRPRST